MEGPIYFSRVSISKSVRRGCHLIPLSPALPRQGGGSSVEPTQAAAWWTRTGRRALPQGWLGELSAAELDSLVTGLTALRRVGDRRRPSSADVLSG